MFVPLAEHKGATLHEPPHMPKRSNEKQKIIEMLKQLTAPHGSKVTASKSLKKSGSKAQREVDIVVEHNIDDEIIIQSFEVVARKRMMTVEWVEQMIGKHRKLPTDRVLCQMLIGAERVEPDTPPRRSARSRAPAVRSRSVAPGASARRGGASTIVSNDAGL